MCLMDVHATAALGVPYQSLTWRCSGKPGHKWDLEGWASLAATHMPRVPSMCVAASCARSTMTACGRRGVPQTHASLPDGGHRGAPARALGRIHAVLILRGRGVQAHADDGPPHAAAGGDRLARAGRVPPLPQLLLPGLCAGALMQLLLQEQSLPPVLASVRHALPHTGVPQSACPPIRRHPELASVPRAGRRALQRAGGLPRDLLQGRLARCADAWSQRSQ